MAMTMAKYCLVQRDLRWSFKVDSGSQFTFAYFEINCNDPVVPLLAPTTENYVEKSDSG